MYPVIKENSFYRGMYILFTGPKRGRVVALGEFKYPAILGAVSDCWAEDLFRDTDIDPNDYPESPKNDY